MRYPTHKFRRGDRVRLLSVDIASTGVVIPAGTEGTILGPRTMTENAYQVDWGSKNQGHTWWIPERQIEAIGVVVETNDQYSGWDEAEGI